MELYCELTRQQIEAALNFIKHVNQERRLGRPLDVRRLRKVVVLRDPESPNKAIYQVEFEDRAAA